MAVAIPLIGGIAGSYAGTALLGTYIGTSMASSIGWFVGQALFTAAFIPTKKADGPRMNDRKVLSSSYGQPIPLLYGSARLSGNVLWSTELHEVSHTEEQGSSWMGNSVEYTTYEYFASLAVGICEGPIQGIRKIWADGELIYDGDSGTSLYDGSTINLGYSMATIPTSWAAPSSDDGIQLTNHIRLYLGSETQNPCGLIEEYVGAGNQPAHRGLAYVVFDWLPVSKYGNRVPSFEFEVVRAADYSGMTTRVYSDPIPPGNSCYSKLTKTTFFIAGPSLIGYQRDNGTNGYIDLEGTLGQDWVDNNCGICTDHAGHLHIGTVGPTCRLLTLDATSFDMLFMRLKKDYAPVYNGLFNAWFYQKLTGLAETRSGALVATTAWVRTDNTYQQMQSPSGLCEFSRVAGNFAVWEPQDAQPIGFCDSPSLFPSEVTSHVVIADTSPYLHVGYAELSGNVLMRYQAIDLTGYGALQYSDHASAPFISWGVPCVVNGDRMYRIDTTTTPGQRILDVIYSQVMTVPAGGTVQAVVAAEDGFYLVRDGHIQAVTPQGTILWDKATRKVRRERGLASDYAVYMSADKTSLVGKSVAYRFGGLNTSYPTAQSVIHSLVAKARFPINVDASTLANESLQGYLIGSRTSIKACLDQLLFAYSAYATEQANGTLKVARYIDAPNAGLIKQDDTGFGTTAEAIINCTPKSSLPCRAEITYMDPDLTYRENTAAAYMLTSTSEQAVSVSVPIVMPYARAEQVANAALFYKHVGQNTTEVQVPVSYSHIEPGDVVSYLGRLWNVKRVQFSPPLAIKLKLQQFDYSVFGAPAVPATADVRHDVVELPSQPGLAFLDIPLFRASDDTPGFYVAAYTPRGYTSNGNSTLYSLAGSTWTALATLAPSAVFGHTTTPLPAGVPSVLDTVSTVTVALDSTGDLFNATFADVLNGANRAVIGTEIFSFTSASEIADGVYMLSGIIRDGSHTGAQVMAGHQFALLNGAVVSVPQDLSHEGKEINLAACGANMAVNTAIPRTRINTNVRLTPLAPVRLAAQKDGQAWNINWIRQARRDYSMRDGSDIPLDQSNERYEVAVLNASGAVVATYTVGTPAFAYTEAQQIADFGAVQSTLSVKVRQMGNYHAGRYSTLTATA